MTTPTTAEAVTRNSERLASLVAYCQAHPDELFWQALRNWSGPWKILSVPWSGVFGDGTPKDTFNVE